MAIWARPKKHNAKEADCDLGILYWLNPWKRNETKASLFNCIELNCGGFGDRKQSWLQQQARPCHYNHHHLSHRCPATPLTPASPTQQQQKLSLPLTWIRRPSSSIKTPIFLTTFFFSFFLFFLLPLKLLGPFPWMLSQKKLFGEHNVFSSFIYFFLGHFLLEVAIIY